jgi:hypothetical protein
MSRSAPLLAERQGKLDLPDKEFRSEPYLLLGGQRLLGAPSLHVAMQMGPSLHPVSRVFGVWPLRILIRSCLGFWRFMVCAISAISMSPAGLK